MLYETLTRFHCNSHEDEKMRKKNILVIFSYFELD